MRCKKHFTDLSSIVGVCASCLRERLFSLIAAQARASQSQAQSHHHHHFHVQAQSEVNHRKSDVNNSNNQPPLVFPRSVSPYISRRKSDNSAAWPPNHHHHHHEHKHSLSDQRFYSTPQIGPSGAYIAPDSGSHKKNHYRFSLITNLFRSKTHKLYSDSISNSDSRFSISKESTTSAPSSSSSWFSGILTGRRRKQSRLFDESTTAATSGVLRVHPGYRDRGMSPARFSEDGEEDEHCESGYSSESSQKWKQTPVRGIKPVTRPNHARNVSGLAFCLSPLVRASPNRHWNQKGLPPDTAFSGEIRLPVKPNISYATAFCKNRSRKLADFGRANPNH